MVFKPKQGQLTRHEQRGATDTHGQQPSSGEGADYYQGGWRATVPSSPLQGQRGTATGTGTGTGTGVGGGGGGSGKNPFEDWWATTGYTKQFQAPTAPGSFGSVGTGGPGGAGKVASIGEFAYDPFASQQFDAPDMTPEAYAYTPFTETYGQETFVAPAPFEAPVESLTFREFDAPVDTLTFRDFQAPTAESAQATPGYEFRLSEGQRALQNAAAAKGMLRTGNTWKDLLRYGQDYATSEYDKVYGRARSEHDLAYQQALQANRESYGRATGEHQMSYQQAQQANRDAYQRALGEQQLGYQQAAQTYGMGREEERSAYDRSFAAQQANEARRIAAQQLGEQSRYGARQANLGAHMANYQIGSGAWDRNFQGQQTQYDYAFQRAAQEAALAESAAARSQSASSANAASRERAYNRQYDRAMQEYLLGYQQAESQQQKEFDRVRWALELGLGTE